MMEKRGIVDESTPAAERPCPPDGAGGPTKEAADAREAHPTRRLADAVTRPPRPATPK